MYFLVDSFYSDLKDIYLSGDDCSLYDLDFYDFFNIVKNIKYTRDIEPVEVTARPKYLWLMKHLGLDCKKKAILMAAWAKGKLPYRFMSVSRMPDGTIHHVFTQYFIDGAWLNIDATYSDMKPFQIKEVTNFEVLKK